MPTSDNKTLLNVINLAAYYRGPDLLALKGINLIVERNEIVVLLGPNGAGKSSVLKSIFKEIKIQDGQIVYSGMDITKLSANQLAKLGISYIPERNKVFGSLTVEENLDMGGYILDDKKVISTRKQKVFDLFPVLAQNRGKVTRNLSGGEQQLTAFGRALMLEPKLLLLDEPSLGLAPKMVELVFEKLKEINRMGVSILLVEQNVKIALQVAHRVYVLNLGEVAFAGTPKQVHESGELKTLYLGG